MLLGAAHHGARQPVVVNTLQMAVKKKMECRKEGGRGVYGKEEKGNE